MRVFLADLRNCNHVPLQQNTLTAAEPQQAVSVPAERRRWL